MADIQLPAWAASVLSIGLPAAGWFGRTLVERLWQRRDRRVLRLETDLQERLNLLRQLNGDIYQKWLWLRDVQASSYPTPAISLHADQVSFWLYKHSSYFPEPHRTSMVLLADYTVDIGTAFRSHVLEHGGQTLVKLWEGMREYQRDVEQKLGLVE